MNKEIFDALFLLEKERGISVDFMLDKIKKAIITACKSSYNGNDNAIVNVDKHTGGFEVYLQKTVVDEVFDPGHEISLHDARKLDSNSDIDYQVNVKLDTKEFGRIAAQTARNIIRQGIRDGERGLILQELEAHRNELVTGIVEKLDPRNGSATLRIGKAEAFLPKGEQINKEALREGDHIKIYIADIKETDRGPKVMISRTHHDFVKKLFESEIPEIYNGVVAIKSIAREAGARTKMAVWSTDPNVDAIGACIGPKGARVGRIVEELGGEKIDIVEYSEDIGTFISAALSPADVLGVEIDPVVPNACRVIVPDNQLSLAIGNRGQNARLAAKLTGFKIDIRPQSEGTNHITQETVNFPYAGEAVLG